MQPYSVMLYSKQNQNGIPPPAIFCLTITASSAQAVSKKKECHLQNKFGLALLMFQLVDLKTHQTPSTHQRIHEQRLQLCSQECKMTQMVEHISLRKVCRSAVSFKE
jgi:hypothetical protein